MKAFTLPRLAIPLLALAALSAAASALAQSPTPTHPCATAAQTTFPHTQISNGQLNAVLYLPDPATGYYRGSRFDWSGVVPCLSYKGHTFFGVWFPHYDPKLHDAITGPVEEFRSADGQSAPFYDQAKPGDSFLKPGIGLLRRTDASPFLFTAPYPLVDGGRWIVHSTPTSVSFHQILKRTNGIGYVYKKNLRLDPHLPVLFIEHQLKNTGTQPIVTEVYDHDFFMLDNAPSGPGMTVTFPFEPKTEKPLGSGVQINGKQIVYTHELQTGESGYGPITGFSASPADYDITVENTTTGVGVQQTSTSPIARMVFWSIPTTICPEAYIHLDIPPGQTARWTIRYRFFAK